MYEKNATAYFNTLVQLAKVLKIEIGQPHDFERPSSLDETLDRLERRAGPAPRKMLERS
jgi:hypothetical protein